MSSLYKKIQKNTEEFVVKEYYKHMTPEMYQDGIKNAIKLTEKRLNEEFCNEREHIINEFNERLQEYTLSAMDTLATEMIYELGRLLDCYIEEPENLEQKIDVVQGIYETAIHSIEDYASNKYKTNKQARKAFEKKKKTIQKFFGVEADDGKKKNK